jgi:transcriptional regulator with XRE-family HTH domain
MKTWRDNVKRILREQGIQQSELAERLHVSEGTISHWMSGRHRPSIDKLREIAAVLHVSMPDLTEGDDAFIRDDTELELLRTIRAVLETLRKPAKE